MRWWDGWKSNSLDLDFLSELDPYIGIQQEFEASRVHLILESTFTVSSGICPAYAINQVAKVQDDHVPTVLSAARTALCQEQEDQPQI